MKKKLYYLLLMALLASCGSKENTEDSIDPNSPSQKLLGNWRQYQHVQYREGFEPIINEYSPPHYYRFMKEQYINGYERDGVVVFNDYGNPYQIKGDSMLSPHYGRMTFAGDSLKIEDSTVITGIDTYTIVVLYRY